MISDPLRVHVLYESSTGDVPHGCSHIRLLRPLSHPDLAAELHLSYGLDLPQTSPHVVIVERLWDYRCETQMHSLLLSDLKRRHVPVLFEIDDDLLNMGILPGERQWPTTKQKMWLRWMLRSADGVIVSTPNLARRLRHLNPVVDVVPNALDERLFSNSKDFRHRVNPSGQITFGYMGTFTHIEDLMSIIEPLRRVLARNAGSVRFEVVGVGDTHLLNQAFTGLPLQIKQVPPAQVSYENFTAWMQNINWDFGIAPLVDTVFSRSKSDMKFLDYAVLGIPGIFSAVPAYSATVKNRHNGLLAASSSQWETALETMIKEPLFREQIAEQAHHEVWQTRMLKDQASAWGRIVRKQYRLAKGIVESPTRCQEADSPSF